MHLILFTGVPGSGKSTFYQQHFFHTHLRVSLDLLRTRNREAQLLEFCFRTQMRLVVDNTNVRKDDRLPYLQMARHHRYRVTGYYFEASLEECLLRNAGRTGKARIDDRGVIAKFRQLQPPSPSEGFDELFRVTLHEGAFMVRAGEE
jgi:predicted kinase